MQEPIPVWKIKQDSSYLVSEDLRGTVETLDQASSILPQGVYTSFRTYKRYFALHMADHFKRLNEGAALLGHAVKTNPGLIRAALKDILATLEGKDFRVRISIDLEDRIGDVYIMAEPLKSPPDQEYQQGVKVLTRPFQRDNPQAKSTRFIQNSLDYRSLLTNEINEVLLFNLQNEIMEGLSSNFFGVCRGVVYTANEGILLGITRAIVLDAAKKIPIEVCLTPVSLQEIEQLEEAFLTSASRAVLPVRQIEQTVIGTGEAGQVTRRISEAFQTHIEEDLEEI